MVFSASRTSLPGVVNVRSLVMISHTGTSPGLRLPVPRARNKSRSVTIPTTCPPSWTTGRLPQLFFHMSSAAPAAFSPGPQEQTFLLIICSTCMELLLVFPVADLMLHSVDVLWRWLATTPRGFRSSADSVWDSVAGEFSSGELRAGLTTVSNFDNRKIAEVAHARCSSANCRECKHLVKPNRKLNVSCGSRP